MATRRTFLHNTAAVGAGIMLAQAQTVRAAEDSGYTDKLTDADGKYAAGPLPFAYDALEPVIDARTVELELTRFRGHLSFCSEGGAHHGKASQPISA